MLRHTKDVKDEADEAVVRCKRQKNSINEYNMLKVVDDTLAVEKVHGRGEPVPVETFGGPQRAGTAGDVGNGDDLLEGDDLDAGDDGDDVDVTHEQGGKEDGNHDKGPDCPRPKVCLFLFVLSLELLCGRLVLLFYRGLVYARGPKGYSTTRGSNRTSLTVASVA